MADATRRGAARSPHDVQSDHATELRKEASTMALYVVADRGAHDAGVVLLPGLRRVAVEDGAAQVRDALACERSRNARALAFAGPAGALE